MQSDIAEIGNSVFVVSAIIICLIAFIFLILIIYYFRVKRSRRQESELKSQFAQTLLQTQLEIQEQTLQHISREVHDNLSQVASLIKN